MRAFLRTPWLESDKIRDTWGHACISAHKQHVLLQAETCISPSATLLSDTTDKTGKRCNPQTMHKRALPIEVQMITKQLSLKFIKLIYRGNNKMQGNGKLPYRVSAQPEKRFMAYTYKSIWGLMSSRLHCESIRNTLKCSIHFGENMHGELKGSVQRCRCW